MHTRARVHTIYLYILTIYFSYIYVRIWNYILEMFYYFNYRNTKLLQLHLFCKQFCILQHKKQFHCCNTSNTHLHVVCVICKNLLPKLCVKLQNVCFTHTSKFCNKTFHYNQSNSVEQTKSSDKRSIFQMLNICLLCAEKSFIFLWISLQRTYYCMYTMNRKHMK